MSHPKHTVHYLKRDLAETIKASRPDEDDYEYAAYDQELFCGDKSIEKGIWDEPGGPPDVSGVDAGYEKNIWCPFCKHIEDFKQIIDKHDPEDHTVHKRWIYRDKEAALFWCSDKQEWVRESDVPGDVKAKCGRCPGCKKLVCYDNVKVADKLYEDTAVRVMTTSNRGK